MMTSSQQQFDSKAQYVNLANSIIEDSDSNQIKLMIEKFDSYEDNPSNLLSEGLHYFDPINPKFQNSRGSMDSLKKSFCF